MITCPWCGTNYAEFRSNCKNCGGPLPATLEPEAPDMAEVIQRPPPPPRAISNNYHWRLLVADGWAIAASIFVLLGAIFTGVGVILTIGIITAFVGIPFALLGLCFLAGGGAIGYWRYQEIQKLCAVLKHGEATTGQILSAEPNYSVRINGRHPWFIAYQFQLNGRDYHGKVSTLNTPGPQFQAGRVACILYLPNSPEHNALYPHP